MTGRMGVHAWVLAGCVAAALGGCTDPDRRASENDPYQTCLDQAYRAGALGPYGPGTLQRAFPSDRIGPRSEKLSRQPWPKSPVEQCNDLRAHGQL